MVPMLERELVSEGADSTNYSFATLKPAVFERVLIALTYLLTWYNMYFLKSYR